MKKFALSVLYVFSIVLAVGIGMAQVGKDLPVGGSASTIKCPYALLEDKDCEQIDGEKVCGYTYSQGVLAFLPQESNYKNYVRSQCGTYNSAGEFNRYDGCKSVSNTPTSDGCSE